MTTETPGPWETQNTAGHDIHGQTAVYDENTGKDVALVYDGDAHAQLMAAGPELLEALRECESQLSAEGLGRMPAAIHAREVIEKVG